MVRSLVGLFAIAIIATDASASPDAFSIGDIIKRAMGALQPRLSPELAERATPVPLQSGDGYSLYEYGCYADLVDGSTRFLSNLLAYPNSATDCLTACSQGGYQFCGLQNGRECWAANSFSFTPQTSTACTYTCSGDGSICGGPSANTLYEVFSTCPSGQFYDTTSSTCLSSCPSGQYENTSGYSPFCDSCGANVVACTDKATALVCATGYYNYKGSCTTCLAPYLGTDSNGNAICIAVQFQDAGYYHSIGCFQDVVAGNPRLLSTSVSALDGLRDVGYCIQACESQNFQYCGLENGGECWGANTLAYTPNPQAVCSTPCGDDPYHLCGGPNAIQVFQFTPPCPSSQTYNYYTASCQNSCPFGFFSQTLSPTLVVCSACGAGAATCTTSVNATTCISPYILYAGSCLLCTAPSAPGLDNNLRGICSPAIQRSGSGYVFSGCYYDYTIQTGNSRILSNQIGNVESVAACLSACQQSNSQYCGLEYGSECWSGDSLPSSLTPGTICPDGNTGNYCANPTPACTLPCVDGSSSCGFQHYLQLYQVGTISTTATTSLSTTATRTNSATIVTTSGSAASSSTSLPSSSTIASVATVTFTSTRTVTVATVTVSSCPASTSTTARPTSRM